MILKWNKDAEKRLAAAEEQLAAAEKEQTEAEKQQTIATAGTVRVSGEAIVLTISLNGSRGLGHASFLSKHSAEINRIAKKRLKQCFSSYKVDAVAISDNTLEITVYGSSTEGRQFLTYGGEKWTSKADTYKYLTRQDIKALLDANDITSVTLSAEWRPGDNVLPYDTAITQGTPDRDLQEHLRRLRDRRKYRLAPVLMALVAVITTGLIAIITRDPGAILLTGAYIGLPLLVAALITWVRVGGVDDEIRQAAATLELRELLPTPEEKQAYRLFQVNGAELKLYYDQALRQRGVVFILGIICVAAGFTLIGVALFVVSESNGLHVNAKIVVAVLGAISGILANFVAVIFLRMFQSIVSSTTSFHERLAFTHQLYLGNVLLAKVDDPDRRADALSKMALALANPNLPEPDEMSDQPNKNEVDR